MRTVLRIWGLVRPYWKRLTIAYISLLVGMGLDLVIPWILRSQWCQMRLRGSRKVPQDKKVSYVLDRFFEQIDWLDKQAPAFMADVRTRARLA